MLLTCEGWLPVLADKACWFNGKPGGEQVPLVCGNFKRKGDCAATKVWYCGLIVSRHIKFPFVTGYVHKGKKEDNNHKEPDIMGSINQLPPKSDRDEVFPVHQFDDTALNRIMNVTGLFRFDAVLEANKLRDSLSTLLHVGDWRKLRGRLRLNVSLFHGICYLSVRCELTQCFTSTGSRQARGPRATQSHSPTTTDPISSNRLRSSCQ